MVEIIKRYEGRYDREDKSPEVFKSLRKAVFAPRTDPNTEHQFKPDKDGNYTPEQETYLVGKMLEFRNEIDMRVNEKGATRNTRIINEDAMKTINEFRVKYKHANIPRIEQTPSTLLKLENTMRDLVKRDRTPPAPRNQNTPKE
jgi:hypothetical protein